MSDLKGYLLYKADMSTLMSFPQQKQLGTTLNKSQQRIDQRVKKWQDLRQAVESVKVRKKIISLKLKQHDAFDCFSIHI